jgi:hypothetical protein
LQDYNYMRHKGFHDNASPDPHSRLAASSEIMAMITAVHLT